LSHAFARQALDSASSPIVFALFSGGKADLLYRFDTAFEAQESLRFLRKSTSNDPEVRSNLYPVTLSHQTIGRDRRDLQRPAFLMTDVRVEVTASAGKEASLTVVETVVPQAKRLSVFRFDLYNTTYALVGAGALQPRAFRVRAVSDGSGRSLLYHHANGEIVVALPEPVEPDRPVSLKFQIDGNFLIRPGGDNFWILGVEPWFPQPDLGAQFYTWHALVKVPK